MTLKTPVDIPNDVKVTQLLQAAEDIHVRMRFLATRVRTWGKEWIGDALDIEDAADAWEEDFIRSLTRAVNDIENEAKIVSNSVGAEH